MYFFGVLLCFTVGSVYAGVVQDIRGRGLDIGGGLSVHLDTVKAEPNASLLDRHALRIDYQGLGVRFGKAKKEAALEVGFYLDEGRGRKTKLSDMIIPALLGFKSTTLLVFSMAAISMFIIKAMIIAKIALILSAVLWATKAFKTEKKSSFGGYELDHHPSELQPIYAEIPGDLAAYGYAASPYVAFPQTEYQAADFHGAAETAAQYAYVAAPENATSSDLSIHGIQSRKDVPKKVRPVQAYITVRRKSVVHK